MGATIIVFPYFACRFPIKDRTRTRPFIICFTIIFYNMLSSILAPIIHSSTAASYLIRCLPVLQKYS